jgi:hypothetical protein
VSSGAARLGAATSGPYAEGAAGVGPAGIGAGAHSAALAVDHLIVAARTLDDGVAWCEATLGITPGPGGKHAFMGTHNRLFSVASARFPRAYFEIIAIDPASKPDASPHASPDTRPGAGGPLRTRWFDLDNPALQQAIAGGPALIHWVARCEDIDAAVATLRGQGVDRGDVVPAERHTPNGLLRWKISLRADGRRLFRGALPTLIQWGEVHPADAMPGSGVVLQSLVVQGLPADLVAVLPLQVRSVSGVGADSAYAARRDGASAANANANEAAPRLPLITATLSTPKGEVSLGSLTIETDHVHA